MILVKTKYLADFSLMLLFGSGRVGQCLDIFCFLSLLKKIWFFTSPLLFKKAMATIRHRMRRP